MQKKYITTIMILLFAIAALICYAKYSQNRQPVLTIGVCADSYWDVPAGESTALMEKAIKLFQSEHPHVQVRLITGIQKSDYHEWLAEKLLAGDEPDLYLVLADDFSTYASIGALRDLTDLMEKDPDWSAENYYPAVIKACSHEGKYYALPLEAAPSLMFVNKTLLTRHHIQMPDNRWTWQDFYDISRQITTDTDGDGKPDAYGSYAYNWKDAALSNNVQLFSENHRQAYFNTPQLKSTLSFLIKLKELNQGYEVSAKDFDLGRVAFRPLTFAEYRTYQPYPWRIKKYSAFDWDVVSFPVGPEGKAIANIYTMRMGISPRTRHPELAWKLLKTFSYRPEIQLHVLDMSQGLPARGDILSTPEAEQLFNQTMRDDGNHIALSVINSIMSATMPETNFLKYTGAILQADTCIQKIINGTLPMDAALNQLQADINAYLLQ